MFSAGQNLSWMIHFDRVATKESYLKEFILTSSLRESKATLIKQVQGTNRWVYADIENKTEWKKKSYEIVEILKFLTS